MKDIEVKKEVVEDLDDIDECLPELTELLEEVKREERDEDEQQSEPDVEEILKNFANEQSSSDSDSADDADIQKLQKLLKEKQRELKESDEKLERKSRKSTTPDRSTNQRKENHKRKRKCESDEGKTQKEKRKRFSSPSRSGSRSETPCQDEEININQSNDVSMSSRNGQQEETAVSVKMEKLPTEEELENILQSSDHSDEEPCSSNQIVNAVSDENEMSVPTSPIQFGYEANPSNKFSDFYDTDRSFHADHRENCSIQEEEEELQCLPVVNSSGFTGMPTFKRIKLERMASADQCEENVATSEETPKDKRNKIFSTCLSLLERLESSETSGKFMFTPTITKADANAFSNSVLQKISNVHYEFQSIGPKPNLSNWRLKEIDGANRNIAKVIGISADAYFSKIEQKADTMTGKLIKVETERHEKRIEEEFEVEEPNLSTFFKSSFSQTDPLVCQKCVARNRIVGHDVGVQAKAFANSIATQTYSTGSDHTEVTSGMSEIQLRALYEFSYLVRESSMNPSIEMFQTRAMDIFKIIQNESKILCPPYQQSSRDSSQDSRRAFLPNNTPYLAHNHQALPTHGAYSHERSNTRLASSRLDTTHPPYMPTAQPPHSPNHTVPHAPPRDPRQAFMNPSPPSQPFHSQSHAIPHPPSRDPRHASVDPSLLQQSYWNSSAVAFPTYTNQRLLGMSHHPSNGNHQSHQAAVPPTNYGYPPAVKENRIAYGRGHRL